MLTLCNNEPRTFYEVSNKLGLKYPITRKHTARMFRLGWLTIQKQQQNITFKTSEVGQQILQIYRLHNETINDVQSFYEKRKANAYAFRDVPKQH
jgi:hypothetical protein